MKQSHWTYKGKLLNEVPDNSSGFVYLITNTETNQKYIGRKYFWSTRRKSLTKKQKAAGRKNRTKVTKESDWKTYTGSSKVLQADIEKYGKDKFKFEILICAETKGQVNFLEETVTHKMNALTDPLFYNDSIGPKRYVGMKKDIKFHEMIVEIFG